MNGRYVKHRTQPPAKGTMGVVRAFQMERSFADHQIAENIMTTWENDFDKLTGSAVGIMPPSLTGRRLRSSRCVYVADVNDDDTFLWMAKVTGNVDFFAELLPWTPRYQCQRQLWRRSSSPVHACESFLGNGRIRIFVDITASKKLNSLNEDKRCGGMANGNVRPFARSFVI
jgi:hypothetical protein